MNDSSDPRTDRPTPLAIAVVGLGALFPGRLGTDGFWRDILDRRDSIRDVPPTHWLVEDYYDPDPSTPDKTYCKRGGFLDPVPFNPMELGLPPVALPSTDTAQILALIVARQVLAEAERSIVAPLDRSRTSVILGVASATELVGHYAGRLSRPAWIKGLREAGLPEDDVQSIAARIASNFVPWTEASFPGMLGNVVAGRIANRLDLGGSNYVTDAACASSLSALQCALRELHTGDSDMVITGGVDALNDILMFMCFSKTPAFSPTSDCRPFSDRADGTIIGEGIGMLALRRLEDAERDGHRIYAVIRGLGSSSDGRATSVYAPRSQGQALALQRAYAQAGYSPSTVELVEAHGTGTVAGDAAEFASLRSVFGPARSHDGDGIATTRPWCALGSVKSQIGHTKAAAGSAGLIKAVLALHHKILPPTIKIDRPNPELRITESPFYLNTQPRPWIRRDDHPRRASVSSFGFGGSNFHVTIEEYVGTQIANRIRHMPAELVLLSAASSEALADRVRALGATDLPTGSLARTAKEACAAFSPHDHYRLALVVADERELRARSDAALRLIASGRTDTDGAPHLTLGAPHLQVGGASSAPGVHLGIGRPAEGRIAFLFPGQGSQYVNMGADLAMTFDVCRAAWDLAAAIDDDGEPLHRIAFPPPAFGDEERTRQEARLTALEQAQPAIAAASLAHLALLSALGLRADCALGHSFGEVMALHTAGAFDARQAVAIARRRGRLMAEAAAGSSGAMIAVPLSRDKIEHRLADWNSDLVVANDNAPAQVILSGPAPSVDAAVALLARDQIPAVRLPVAAAFHSPSVAPSQEPFEAFLASMPFAPLTIPVIANSTAAPYPSIPERQRALLAGQIARVVRFRESVERLYEDGVRLFIEVGPGHVLSRLVGQTLGDCAHHAIALDRRGHNGVVESLNAIGRLAALGQPLDYAWLFRETPPQESGVPARTPATLEVLGSNYGKPYPPSGGASALPAPNAAAPVMNDTTPPTSRPAEQQAPRPAARPPQPANYPDPVPATSDVAMLVAQIAETHRGFQQNMAAAHQSFLGMVERVLTGASDVSAIRSPATVDAPLIAAPMPAPPFETVGAWMAPPATPQPAVPQVAPPVAAPRTEPVLQVEPPRVAETGARNAATLASARDTLLAIVSEKTGYPIEMLDLEMEIEANLGIDSIKQVEILSAFRERRPDLPEIAPHQLASLRTLGAIVTFADSAAPAPVSSATAPVPRSDQAVAPAVAQPAIEASGGIRETLLAIVSEKTGYPVEMLDLEMEIEANLGIDSIKQVEILSAFREQRPDLPEIAPHQLASLRTLGAIVAFANGSASHPAPARDERPAATPPSSNIAAGVSDTIARRVLEVVPAPAAGMAMPHLVTGISVAVTGGSDALREAVAESLRARGVEAQSADRLDGTTRGVIHLGTLDTPSTSGDAVRVLTAALAHARTLAECLADADGVFVTVQDTGGTFGIESDPGSAAWAAGLPALAKTLAVECPRATIKSIDIACADRSVADVANAIADELLLGGPGIEIGLPNRERRVAVVTRETLPTPERGQGALADGQVVVVSGGARGITAHAVIALARAARLRVVLLGRTRPVDEDPFPGVRDEAALRAAFAERARSTGESLQPREIGERVAHLLASRETSATIAAVAATGASVRYVALDIRDRDAVGKALADVRAEWGPIAGVIHGAGVIADKRLRDKTDAQIDRVIGTKLDGLAALLDATESDPLAWLCLFSSVAARAGNVGQGDYAVANEVLNKVAQREARRRPDCVVKSIGWGPWDGGMVRPALRDQFTQRGVSLIGMDAGAAFLIRELTAGDRAVEVVAGSGDLNGGRSWSTEIEVSTATHPYLKDHVVHGRPVVPAVLLIEWCCRLAREVDPTGASHEVRDLNVVRPLALNDFSREGVARFIATVRVDAASSHLLNVTLTDRRGVVHCMATVDLRPDAASTTHRAGWRGEGASDWPWNTREIYEGRLFHGTDFHVIRSLDGVSGSGAACTVVGVDDRRWPGGPWVTDPAALDGGLQLAAAWGVHQTRQRFLPTRVARIRWMGGSGIDSPLRCELSSRMVGGDKMISDVVFTSADGRFVAGLDGVEMFTVDAAAVAK